MKFTNLFTPTGMIPGQSSKREVSGVPSTTEPVSASTQTALSGNWSERVVSPAGRRSLLIPAWYRGVSLLMQTMGQMVIQYQRMNGEGQNFIEDRYGDAQRLNYLLQVRPNPLMTASQLQEQIEFKKIYYGNAFVYIERSVSGWPENLWLCTNGSYDCITDSYSLSYNRRYGPALIQAPASDVLHFKNVFLSEDFYMGIPTIRYAMKALSISATADEQALKDMATGGKNKILIQEKDGFQQGIRGKVNQNELKKATQQFSEDWMSSDVAMLSNVADAKVINQTASELRLLETRGYSCEDLARILGIPKVMMMIGEGGNYKMPEHATQEFLLRTIQPRIREHEDEYNSKLLTAADFGHRRIHVCELPLRRLDAKGQADIDILHLQSGWSVNEIRAQYDLPNIKGGDVHYISTNLAEVGSEKLRGSSPETISLQPINPKEGGTL